MCVCVYMYACMDVYVCIIRMRMCVFMHVCMYVCIYVCMCNYVCMYVVCIRAHDIYRLSSWHWIELVQTSLCFYPQTCRPFYDIV